MPIKISDDFTDTLRYRNDLSKIKQSKNSQDLRMMDYIFIMEKQIQELYKKTKENDNENG